MARAAAHACTGAFVPHSGSVCARKRVRSSARLRVTDHRPVPSKMARASGFGRLHDLDEGQQLARTVIVAADRDAPTLLQIAQRQLRRAIHDRGRFVDHVDDALIVRALDRHAPGRGVDGRDLTGGGDVSLLRHPHLGVRDAPQDEAQHQNRCHCRDSSSHSVGPSMRSLDVRPADGPHGACSTTGSSRLETTRSLGDARCAMSVPFEQSKG